MRGCRNGGLRSVEHRGVRFEIKLAPGGRQWVWIVHTSPNPRQGLVGGPRQLATFEALKAINRWWKQRHGSDAARTIRANGGSRRNRAIPSSLCQGPLANAAIPHHKGTLSTLSEITIGRYSFAVILPNGANVAPLRRRHQWLGQLQLWWKSASD